jgi:hypothetical protein
MIIAVGVAALLSTGVLAAEDDVRVTITGCVVDGDEGSFVLTNVQELSDGKMKPTTSLYWLSTTKGLKEHVGQRVEVTGTYSPSRDEGKTGTIAIASDAATGEETITVENGAKKAEATTTTGAVGTSGVKTEITKPYRRLEVQNLKMLVKVCSAP